MSTQMPSLPGPSLSPVSEPYWRAAGEGRLLIQRCGSCGTHRHPPTTACYVCQSQLVEWDDMIGTGTVYSYIWADKPVAPVFEHLGLYNVAVIELDGTTGAPVRIVSRVNGVTKETLQVGMRVTVSFDPIDDEVALPVFDPLP